jgi:murein DD-endopeptidase MepM/ murein hydrolase activator NlpD
MKVFFTAACLWALFVCPLAAQDWYVVQKGDTLWSVSRRFGLSLEAMKAQNGLKSEQINIGQRLRVSPPTGAPAARPAVSQPVQNTIQRGADVRHTVAAGETLWSISRRYKVTVDDIKRSNGLNSENIQTGQVLLVRGGTPPAAATQTPPAAARAAQPPRQAPQQRPPAASAITFSWPLRGPVVERFGVQQQGIINGITISAPQETEVRAAAAGTVTYCGPLRGYGQVVIIRHDGVFYSVYANLSQIHVRQGSLIGAREVVGRTGFVQSVGRHGVHFQLYRQSSAVNPLSYLT